MAGYGCFFQSLKSWISLVFVIFALVCGFSTAFSLLLIMLSTLVYFRSSKQKAVVILDKVRVKNEEASRADGNNSLSQEEEQTAGKLIPCSFISTSIQEENIFQGNKEEEDGDLHSESESIVSNSDEDEWLCNVVSDGSISDEESLIEISIPSGQFPIPKPNDDEKFIKIASDFSPHEMNESSNYEMINEDNLIEIDIYMVSIKCSSFEI